MGISCCKHKGFLRDPYVSAPTTEPIGASSSSERSKPPKTTSDSKMVDSLVLETLGVIGSLVDNEQEPPFSLVKLRIITDKEEGWIQMVSSMVKVIPLENAMGPSVITLLLDDCPLPSKESVIRVSQLLNLSGARARTEPVVVAHERNIFVVLGCIAEKLAGPNSIAILTDDTLDYLLTFIESYRLDPRVVLHALIAIEKFAQTTENKVSIKRKFIELETNPLLALQTKTEEEDYVWRQVGFCARWNLDNLFMIEGRKYSHETVDMSRINVLLNTRDVSEYLKISPDGLEARSDSYSFESVRCTYQVDTGCWYYEAEIVTPGVMQIGWATKNSHFLNHDGYGIGDDLFSVSYDGCRRLVWHNAHSEPQTLPTWKPGDILGCLLDLEKMEAIFAINGNRVKPFYKIFENARTGFFAGASFMSFQQCRFNFGSEPFKFPPTDRHFFSFNRFGYVRPEDKVVIPRHIYLERLRQITVPEDSCTLCYDRTANIILIPCKHKGFCAICISQLRDCPMCRGRILATKQEPTPVKGAGASNYEGPYGASTSKAASNYNINSSNGIGISKSAGSFRSATLPKNGVNWKAVGPSKSVGSYKFSRASGAPRLAAGLRNTSDPRLDEVGNADVSDETGHSEDGNGFHTELRLNRGDSLKGSEAPASILGACEEESPSDNVTPVNDDKEKPGSEMPTHENTDNT